MSLPLKIFLWAALVFFGFYVIDSFYLQRWALFPTQISVGVVEGGVSVQAEGQSDSGGIIDFFSNISGGIGTFIQRASFPVRVIWNLLSWNFEFLNDTFIGNYVRVAGGTAMWGMALMGVGLPAFLSGRR